MPAVDDRMVSRGVEFTLRENIRLCTARASGVEAKQLISDGITN